MFLVVSDNEIIEEISHIIKTPQEIVFIDKSALDKASELGLGEPKTISLVYSDKKQTLAWRVDWEHTPTNEEINNKTISGYLLSASNGEVLDTFVYQIDPKTEVGSQNKSTTNFIPLLVLGILFLIIIILVIKRRK
jgi:restriction endonuclease Mrr